MDEEFFVFDSDFMNRNVVCIENCTFIRSPLPHKCHSIYVTRDPDKICKCNILVIKIEPNALLRVKRLREDVDCTIYTTNVFKALGKCLADGVPSRSTILYINKAITKFENITEEEERERKGGAFKFVKQSVTAEQRTLDGINTVLSSYYYLRTMNIGKRAKLNLMKNAAQLSEEIKKRASVWTADISATCRNQMLASYAPTSAKSISGGYHGFNFSQQYAEPMFFPHVTGDSGLFMCNGQMVASPRTLAIADVDSSSSDEESCAPSKEATDKGNPLFNIRQNFDDDN